MKTKRIKYERRYIAEALSEKQMVDAIVAKLMKDLNNGGVDRKIFSQYIDQDFYHDWEAARGNDARTKRLFNDIFSGFQDEDLVAVYNQIVLKKGKGLQ